MEPTHLSPEKEAVFPNLRQEDYHVTSEADPNYNCIAHAAGRSDAPWWPVEHGTDSRRLRFTSSPQGRRLMQQGNRTPAPGAVSWASGKTSSTRASPALKPAPKVSEATAGWLSCFVAPTGALTGATEVGA
jgi:hypothetical protein